MNSVIKFLEFQPIYINKDNKTAYIILNNDNVEELYRIFTGNQECKRLSSIVRRGSLSDIHAAIVFKRIKIGNSTYMYIKYIYDSLTYRYDPSEYTDNKRFVGDLINENIIFLYSFYPDENIIKINTQIHPELADNKLDNLDAVDDDRTGLTRATNICSKSQNMHISFQSLYIDSDSTIAFVTLNINNIHSVCKLFYNEQDANKIINNVVCCTKTRLIGIKFHITKMGDSSYIYPVYTLDEMCNDALSTDLDNCTQSYLGDLINKNMIFLYRFNPDENIIEINTGIHPDLADNEAKNKRLNNKPNIKNSITKKVTVSKLSKIRTDDTDYEDIINKLYKIVGELSCRETSGNCNSSNGWSDLCNTGIKLFNKLK